VHEQQRVSKVWYWVPVALLAAPFAGVAWWVYDSPEHPDDAGLVATQATHVVVRAAGGEASVCKAMRDVTAPGEAKDIVKRCMAIAKEKGAWLGVRDLHATDIDVGRSSGEVTVRGTLMTPGPTFPLSFTWPVSREDNQWVVSDGPDVEVG
jgi:hypothetical protein